MINPKNMTVEELQQVLAHVESELSRRPGYIAIVRNKVIESNKSKPRDFWMVEFMVTMLVISNLCLWALEFIRG